MAALDASMKEVRGLVNSIPLTTPNLLLLLTGGV